MLVEFFEEPPADFRMLLISSNSQSEFWSTCGWLHLAYRFLQLPVQVQRLTLSLFLRWRWNSSFWEKAHIQGCLSYLLSYTAVIRGSRGTEIESTDRFLSPSSLFSPYPLSSLLFTSPFLWPTDQPHWLAQFYCIFSITKIFICQGCLFLFFNPFSCPNRPPSPSAPLPRRPSLQN